MFATTAFLEVENTYRREQLRHAWGGPKVLRLRRRRWTASRRGVHRPVQLARSGAVAGAR
jgi:hypothetical protein